MKSAGALGTHLTGEVTTVATCWKVTRTDGVVFGFTDHDINLTVSGIVYAAATGYTRSAIQTSAALNVDNLELEGAFDSAGITESDLKAGLWDYATVEIFQVNWADLTQGTLKLRKGQLGEIKAGRYAFNTELRGLTQHLQQSAGRLYGPQCDADFADSLTENRCKLVAASYTSSGTITSVVSNRIFSDGGRSEAAGYYDFGKITFTSGLNNGLSTEIKTYAVSGAGSPTLFLITLQLPMPYTVAVGDTYSILAGCAKNEAACKVFGNFVNFRGFPDVPGSDVLVGGGING